MKDMIYNSKYQNLHMDRAKSFSMFTVNLTSTSALASSATPRLLATITHNLGYVPQFWGLWDIQYGAGLDNVVRRGYGYISHNTGIGLTANFYYTVDSTAVKVYFHYETAGTKKPTGTTAKFTGYLFANDRLTQDYTS